MKGEKIQNSLVLMTRNEVQLQGFCSHLTQCLTSMNEMYQLTEQFLYLLIQLMLHSGGAVHA